MRLPPNLENQNDTIILLNININPVHKEIYQNIIFDDIEIWENNENDYIEYSTITKFEKTNHEIEYVKYLFFFTIFYTIYTIINLLYRYLKDVICIFELY